MLNIVLYQTDQPQNVGSILRTATAFGVKVHIIEPLGFLWSDKGLKRAGMDYLDRANYVRYHSFDEFLEKTENERQGLALLTTKGATPLQEYKHTDGMFYVFGQESCGAPDWLHDLAQKRLIINMVEGERSINLAQSAAILMYHCLYIN